MTFTLGIHYYNGTKNYDQKEENYTQANQKASEASRDPNVIRVTVNCQGVAQQLYEAGRAKWNLQQVHHESHTSQCSHGNYHKED